MLRIFKYFRRIDVALIVICVGLIVSQVYLELKIPEYMSTVTYIIEESGGTQSQVWEVCIKMLFCAIGSLFIAIFVGVIAAYVGASFSRRLRSVIYDKVDSFSMADIDRFSTASLVTRSTNDVTQVRMLITMGLQMIIKAPIMAIWAIVNVSNKRVEWSIATLVAVVILCLMFGTILLLVIPKFGKIQTMTDNLNRITRENLLGLSVVRAYNAENYQQSKFEHANKSLIKMQIFTSQASSVMLPIMSFVMNGLTLSIFLIGAYIINSSVIVVQLSIFSNMIVFSSYSVLIVQAFMQISMIFIFLPRATVSAKRINEVLDVKPSIIEGDRVNGIEGLKGVIEFENVSFLYEKASGEVLKDITFSVASGETVAIIGSTGSGKTTLVNMINRFYDVTSGIVKVNGIDVKEYKTEALYSKIGLVTQKAVMFDGTVTSNVAFGQDNADISSVMKAIEIAEGKEFVESMTDTYDAQIARGGGNISGGQKQRLSIARAIFKNPEILIFDDSFSALDYKTDRTVRTALKTRITNTTKIIVAQRIGTIIDADKIIVLDMGKIAGIGTHKELLQNCLIYKEIAYSQLSEEELSA